MRMTGGRQNYSMLEPGVCDVIWRCSKITLFVPSYLIAGLDDDPWTALLMWEKKKLIVFRSWPPGIPPFLAASFLLPLRTFNTCQTLILVSQQKQ